MDNLRQSSAAQLAMHTIGMSNLSPTTGGSSMVLHSLSLAVESVILGTCERGALSASEAALERSADRAELASIPLRSAKHCSLGEHCCGSYSIESLKLVQREEVMRSKG